MNENTESEKADSNLSEDEIEDNQITVNKETEQKNIFNNKNESKNEQSSTAQNKMHITNLTSDLNTFSKKDDSKEQHEILSQRFISHSKTSTKPIMPSLTLHTLNHSKHETKSIFTKLSEDMYNNYLHGDSNNGTKTPKHKYDFNSLIDEQFIQTYAEKFNENNNIKFKNFLERNHKPKSIQKGKNNTSLSENKPKKSKNERSKEINSFLDNQKAFVEKKQQNLNELKTKIHTEQEQNVTSIPQISENSNTIVNQMRSNNENENHKDVFTKLFDEKNNKIKQEALLAKVQNDINKEENRKEKEGAIIYPKKSTPKKLTTNEIKELVDNLHHPQIKIKNSNTNHNGEYISVKTTPNKDLTSQPSNSILIQRFLKCFDIEASNMFNTRSDENHELTYNEFTTLLSKLGFTSNGEDNSNNKEQTLISDAWKLLINTSNTKNEEIENNNNTNIKEIKGQSFDVLLFLLCVQNLYKGGVCPLIQKNLPFIELDETSPHIIKPKDAKYIQTHFRELFNNSMNNLFKQKAQSKLNRLTELNDVNIHKTHENIPSSSTIKHNPIKTYDLIRKKREISRERLQEEKQAKELKECTFYPNNSKPTSFSANVSAEVTNRLYSQRPQRQHKQSDQNKKTDNDTCSFTPMTSKIDSKMFAYNPIKDDKSVNKKVEQYEKARMDKRLSNYLLKQGTKFISNYEVINNLNKQIDPPVSFKFDNEYKGYKNTFEKFNYNNKHKGNNNEEGKGKEVKYVFEFNVENQIKTLKIYKGDNIMKSVNKFCSDNNLEKESRDKIMTAIKDKINEH